jgi:hypothetical protein
LTTVPGGRGLTANEPQRDDIVVVEGHSHVVGFYETEAFLTESVRDFLAPGLLAGDAAIVVATGAHTASFESALTGTGLDLREAQQRGRYVPLDAGEALSTFMVDGMPDTARFRATIGGLVRRAGEGPRQVRIYGEMVAVLWDEGNVAAAVALEDLWNDLATTQPFSLFCAYPMQAFCTEASTGPFRRICGQHSSVIPTERYSGVAGSAEHLRAVAFLEQQAGARVNERVGRVVEEIRASTNLAATSLTRLRSDLSALDEGEVLDLLTQGLEAVRTIGRLLDQRPAGARAESGSRTEETAALGGTRPPVGAITTSRSIGCTVSVEWRCGVCGGVYDRRREQCPRDHAPLERVEMSTPFLWVG